MFLLMLGIFNIHLCISSDKNNLKALLYPNAIPYKHYSDIYNITLCFLKFLFFSFYEIKSLPGRLLRNITKQEDISMYRLMHHKYKKLVNIMNSIVPFLKSQHEFTACNFINHLSAEVGHVLLLE